MCPGPGSARLYAGAEVDSSWRVRLMRILVTGAAGAIGRAVGERLPGLGHELRALDLVGEAVPGFELGWVTGDCADPEIVAPAVEGVDAVVHLAGNAGESALPDALRSHVVTTGVLLDAMVGNGVSRIAYASSNHAVGHTERRDLLTTDVRPRPDTFYGAAKVAAEGLLSLYVDRHGIGAVAMRIGSFRQVPTTQRHLATWLSPGDCARMIHAAVTAPEPGFQVIYGISANTRRWWDLEPGRRIGFDPQDDAEAFAHQVPLGPDDAADAAYVGGLFVDAPLGGRHGRPSQTDGSGP